MYEVAVDKWHGGCMISIETRDKVMKKYGTEGGSRYAALAAALEDSVKDVKLTRAELARIRAEIKANYDKRMKRREDIKKGTAVKRRK